MGGLFGVVSENDCVYDLFFGTDYHSHLGTRRGGLSVLNGSNFQRVIHNIENSPFRTKFERDITEMSGRSGIGCISDSDPQPLNVRSAHGNFSIATVGRINNKPELVSNLIADRNTHFLEMSDGEINSTELVAALISQCDSVDEGIKYAQSLIDGSISLLLLTQDGIIAARDRYGRTPLIIAVKDGAYCASFESSAYINLGYHIHRELGPGEIVRITQEGCETLSPPGEDMKICAFLWVYYGYPSSVYEGVNVESMRYNCGRLMSVNDSLDADNVSGVPDSGAAYAIGYANNSHIPFARPLVKYTPTWPRSFTPPNQDMRSLIAKMKLIPIDGLIRNHRMVLIDDSIVRGTQLGEMAEFLHASGACEVHVRTACPPTLYSCKYLNFTRSVSYMDLIARRVIAELEDGNPDGHIEQYADDTSGHYDAMIERIREKLDFTTLKYNKLSCMLDSVGIGKCKLCTYCWTGRE